jgi:hypothetical protein
MNNPEENRSLLLQDLNKRKYFSDMSEDDFNSLMDDPSQRDILLGDLNKRQYFSNMQDEEFMSTFFSPTSSEENELPVQPEVQPEVQFQKGRLRASVQTFRTYQKKQ